METMDFDRTTETITVRVAVALASAIGTDPFDMEPPLYETIDPEALNQLFRPGAGCRVTFEHDGHSVEVRDDGIVAVDGRVADAEMPDDER